MNHRTSADAATEDLFNGADSRRARKPFPLALWDIVACRRTKGRDAFAIQLGVSFPPLNEVINAKRSVTPDTALRLARLMPLPAPANGGRHS